MNNPCVTRKEDAFNIKKPNAFEMVDVGNKPETRRRAAAQGTITMGQEAYKRLIERTLPKGDALALAEIAGVTAAKKTAEVIPLCHPLPLDKVAVSLDLDDKNCSVTAHCAVSAFAKTGVEMEALAGVNGALLGLYDLIKGVDAALTISGIQLNVKEGGKKGYWVHPNADACWQQTEQNLPLQNVRTAVITLSDRASKGEYADLSGPAGIENLTTLGAEVVDTLIMEDDKALLAEKITELATSENIDLIITTGGTGIAERDTTPEALDLACDKLIPGFGELLRQDGAQFTPFSWISRSAAGIAKDTLVIALPGNPKAVKEGLNALKGILPHTLKTLKKIDDHEHQV
jgi:molybdenum cofactor biosynthesis protein MoaC